MDGWMIASFSDYVNYESKIKYNFDLVKYESWGPYVKGTGM